MADPALDAILSGKPSQSSGDPLLDAILHGAKKADTGDPALDAALNGKSSGPTSDPILDQILGGHKPKPTDAQQVSQLEQEAQAVGAPMPAQDSPGLFRRALDLISRPNYAVAGAAEELFSPQGHGVEAALKRAGTEIFSGIGGLHGQKEGFAQVLEHAGVSELGQFSDLVPGLYNTTGEGWQFQKGGWADPTGRGAIGLGLDIAADPTTYLGFGVAGKTTKVGDKFLSKAGQKALESEAMKATGELAVRAKAITALKRLDPTLTSTAARTALGKGTEAAPVLRDLAIKTAKDRVQAAIEAGATDLLDRGGIKWAGIHLADNPLAAVANSGVAKDLAARLAPTTAGKMALASAAWTKKWLTDPLGNFFVRGYGIKGLEGALPIIDDHLNLQAFRVGEANKLIEASPFSKWVGKSDKAIEAEWTPVIDAFEKGGIGAVPQEYKPAMQFYVQATEQMHGNEVAAGLLTHEKKVGNYFAHYYGNDPADLEKVLTLNRGSTAQGTAERMLRLGRNAEERAYETLKDAREVSTNLNRVNKAVPILEPIYNPMESLRRRWEHSITKRTNREMMTALEGKFGQLPFDASEVFSLATPVKYGAVAAKDGTAIDAILNAGPKTDKIAAVSKLSDDAKKLYFINRFADIGSREESFNVLNKYHQFSDYFPRQMQDGLGADGTVFKNLKDKFTDKVWTLPSSLRDEVAAMSDHVVQSKAGRQALQGYDTIQNLWKSSVTWLFPAFHVRNAYSNVAQSFVDIGMHALNPESYRETAQILFGKGEGTFKTKLGAYSYDEVRKILNRNGVNTSAAAKAEFTGNAAAFDKVGGAIGWARKGGTAIENESRAQLALNYLRRGMDPAEVGARVKKFQLDYSNGLTNFERQWMKRLVPFYSFQRLNLGLQFENLAKRPGMVASQLKPFRGRADEDAQMTSWDAGALKLRLNRDGKTVQMITGIDLPIRNLDLLFRGNVRDSMASAIGMLTPILKVPIEVAANKSLFTGNDFDRANVPTAGRIVEQMPVSVQRWLGYKKEPDKAGRPQYTLDAQRYYLLGQSFVLSRFLSTSDRQWRQYVDKADGNALQSALDFTTGLRWQEMNMDDEMAARAKERKADLERALVRWGQRKEFSTTYTPKGTR